MVRRRLKFQPNANLMSNTFYLFLDYLNNKHIETWNRKNKQFLNPCY